MASSVMHLCATKLALDGRAGLDLILLGAVMPDGFADSAASHWRTEERDGLRGFDLDGFLAVYGKGLCRDPYALGYYLHLLQDSHYRRVVHRRNDWNAKDPAFVEALHRDYWYLNPPLTARWQPFLPETLPDEVRAHTLCPPDAQRFLAEKRDELVDPTTGPLTVLTEDMANEWIREAAAVTAAEVSRLDMMPSFTMMY